MLNERKVNLFIVGAAKSGTTTVYNQLASYPGVCMSSIKEPNYFSSSELIQDDLYYREKIITSKKDYEQLFNPDDSDLIIGEASVSYLFYPGTAEKIFNYNPSAKIIILLRDPVQRAFSHYQMDKQLGFTKNTFDDIIHSEKEGAVPSKYFQQYVRYGLYSQQIARYFNIFPSSQVLVILFDDLIKSPESVLHKITGFLGLNEEIGSFTSKRSNETLMPQGLVIKTFYKLRPLRKAIKLLLPEIMIKKLQRWFFTSPSGKLSSNQEIWLRNYFRTDVLALEKIINRKLSTWYDN